MTISEMQKFSTKFKWRKVDEDASVSSCESVSVYVRGHFRIFEKVLNAWSRFTKGWKSDICYEIFGVYDAAKELEGMKIERGKEYPLRIIGIRECGVDHPEYIKCRLESNDMGEYKAVYLLTIACLPGNGKSLGEYIMRLYKKTA